jgi:hypothetical protein
MPVAESQAFVVTDDGRPVARAHMLTEIVGLIMRCLGVW